MFQLQSGQFLQYAKITHMTRGIWPVFPAEPEESQTLKTLLDTGSSDGLISRVYKALKQNRRISIEKARAVWSEALLVPLTDGEWSHTCAQVKEVASNVRFKLTQFYYLHRAYLTPQRLCRIYQGRSGECPRCGVTPASFLHITWECSSLSSFWEGEVKVFHTATRLTFEMAIRNCLLGLIPLP